MKILITMVLCCARFNDCIGFVFIVVVVVVVCHIQRIGCQPEKTTLHGGQSRSWSAEQGKENKRKSLAAYPPPTPHLDDVLVCLPFCWCPCMAINVSVQYDGGFLPDIILLTQCYYHRGTRLNVMKRFCIFSY